MIGVQGPLKNGKVFRVVTAYGSKDFNIKKYGKRAARKLAQDYADEWNEAVETNTTALTNVKYTVDDIMYLFLVEFNELVSMYKRVPESYSTYKNELKRISLTKYGVMNYRVVQFDTNAIEKALYSYKCEANNYQGWSHDAVSKSMKALKYAYTTCRKAKLIKDNPMYDYRFDKGATNTDTDENLSEIIIPTEYELQCIFKVADPKWRLFYKIAAATGMRVSELRGLAFSNIDFPNNQIYVKQQASQKNQLTTRLKTKNSDRQIPLHASLKAELLQRRDDMGYLPSIGHNSNFRAKGIKTDLVFPTIKNTPHSRQHIWNKFDEYKKAAQINLKGSMHCFRHFYASNLIDMQKKKNNLNPKKISTMLGHSSYTFTETVYGHLIYPPHEEQALVNDISNSENFAFLN